MSAISFSGLASGLDTDAIVSALVGVQRVPLLRLQEQNRNSDAQLGIIDNLSSALSKLRTAAGGLDTKGEFLSYKGSIADTSVANVTASGLSVPGNYELEVTQLAAAQRTYSNTFADKDADLSASDQTLSLTIGGTQTDLTVAAGSSLQDVADLINGSGAKVSAGILYDGTNYRLQVVGSETGASNAITFSDSGLGLGLSVGSNTVQAAVDAQFTLDGFAITSPDNLVDDVIPGTTLELKKTTTSATEVTLAADSAAVKKKMEDFVTAYNGVFSIINAQVGEGKGRNTLSGDSTVRGLEQSLSRLISSPIPGLTTSSGDSLQLADLGIKTNRDGTLTLDGEKFDEAMGSGFANAARYFAGDETADIGGMSEQLDDLIESYVNTTDGLLKARKDGLNATKTANTTRIEEMERFLTGFEDNLRRQFTSLESTMSSLQSQQQYLAHFLQR